jgi:hypothetical protein
MKLYIILLLAFLHPLMASGTEPPKPAPKPERRLTVKHEGKELTFPKEEINRLEKKIQTFIEKHISEKHSRAIIDWKIKADVQMTIYCVLHADPPLSMQWDNSKQKRMGIDAGTTELEWDIAGCERYRVLAVVCYLSCLEPTWENYSLHLVPEKEKPAKKREKRSQG